MVRCKAVAESSPGLVECCRGYRGGRCSVTLKASGFGFIKMLSWLSWLSLLSLFCYPQGKRFFFNKQSPVARFFERHKTLDIRHKTRLDRELIPGSRKMLAGLAGLSLLSWLSWLSLFCYPQGKCFCFNKQGPVARFSCKKDWNGQQPYVNRV